MKTKKHTKPTPKLKASSRVHWKPGTMLYPIPAVLVTCGITPDEHNIITVGWTGTICTDPAMLYISLRPERHSFTIIKKNMEFVINLPGKRLVKAVDFCGVKSGKDINKWEKTGLTPIPSKIIQTPQIKECPVSIECKVDSIQELGSHHMFISNVVGVSVDSALINEKGYFNLAIAELISYTHGFYNTTEKRLGKFGFSVKKD